MKTRHPHYDIIGDIHGHADTLRALLMKLDYKEQDGAYHHAERKVIFVGDFIDRGPKIRETLEIVRAMVEAGTALAVMGNHEYNALCFATEDGKGGYLRPHNEKNVGQHAATLEAFKGREGEWRAWLNWFEKLPLFLDLGGLRIAHACWDETAIRDLGGSNRFDASLLCEHGVEFTTRQDAVNTLLKGPEINVPDGREYAGGRKDMRVKWWLNDRPLHYPGVALGVPFELPDEPITTDEHRKICGYTSDAPPVFFGHYGFLKPAEPIAPNVACIDLGVTRGGPLCAYLWDGGRELDAGKFVCAAPQSDERPSRL